MLKSMNCSICNKEFYYNNVTHKKREFCSRICRANSFPKISIQCKICNTIALKQPSRAHEKCCSRACRDLYMRKEYHSPLALSYDQSIERLKISFYKKITRTETCWLWKGSINHKGYGLVGFSRKNISAHRASWIIHNGQIPAEKWILHHCDVRNCVNPLHLFIGDLRANIDDMMKKGRQNSAKGEAQPNAKFKNNDIIEIREMFKINIPISEIANKFNVAKSTIKNIKSNKAWRHVL